MTSTSEAPRTENYAAGAASYPIVDNTKCVDIKTFYSENLGLNVGPGGQLSDPKNPGKTTGVIDIYTRKACPTADPLVKGAFLANTACDVELVDWAFMCNERDAITNKCIKDTQLPTNIAFDEINFGFGLAVMPPVVLANPYQYPDPTSTTSTQKQLPSIPFGYISTGTDANGLVAAPTDGAAFVVREPIPTLINDEGSSSIDSYYHIGNHDLWISTTKNASVGVKAEVGAIVGVPKRYNFDVISRPLEGIDDASIAAASSAAAKEGALFSVKPFFNGEVTPRMITTTSIATGETVGISNVHKISNAIPFINGIAVSVLKNAETWNRFLALASITISEDESYVMPIMLRDFVYSEENVKYNSESSRIAAVACRLFERPPNADTKTYGLGGVALATMKGPGTWYAVSDCKKVFVGKIVNSPPEDEESLNAAAIASKIEEEQGIKFKSSPSLDVTVGARKVGYTPVLASEPISSKYSEITYITDEVTSSSSYELHLFGSGSMSADGERIIVGATALIEKSGTKAAIDGSGSVLNPRKQRQSPPRLQTILTYEATYDANDHDQTDPNFKLIASIESSDIANCFRYAAISASGHVLVTASQAIFTGTSGPVVGMSYDVYALSTKLSDDSDLRKWVKVGGFGKSAKLSSTYLGNGAAARDIDFYNPYTLSPSSAPDDNIYTPVCVSVTGRRIAAILAFGPASSADGIGKFGQHTNSPKNATVNEGKIYVDIAVWTYVSDHLDLSGFHDNGSWILRIERAAYMSTGTFSSAPVGVRFLDSTGGIIGVDIVALAPSAETRATAVIAVKSGDGGVDAAAMLDSGWNIGPHIGAKTQL